MTAIIEAGRQMIIREANELVMARYKLPRTAQRLLLLLFSRIKREDEKFYRYELGFDDIYKVLNLKKQNSKVRKARLVRTIEALLTNILKIIGRNEGGEFLKMSAWIEAPTIKWDERVVSLRLAEHLKEYLLELDVDFTAYPYEEAIQFRNGCAFRLYKMCRNLYPRANFNSTIENGFYVHKEKFSLKRFREILGISSEHGRISNFRKRVLEAAREELQEKTRYRFEYKLIRTGRPFTDIEICFQGEPIVSLEEDSETLGGKMAVLKKELLERGVPEETIEDLKELGASAACVRKAFAKYSIEQVEEAVRVAREEEEEKELRHADGFLKKALEKGWRSKKTRKFERERKFKAAREAEEAEEKRQAELAKEEDEKYAANDNKEKFKYVLKNLSGFRESYDALSSKDQDALREYAYEVFENFSSYKSTYKYIQRELLEYQ